MKKLCSVLLFAILLQLAAVVALAAPGAFVESPGRTAAPSVIDVAKGHDCTLQIETYAYNERGELDPIFSAHMADACHAVADAEDLGELGGAVSALAESYGIETSALSACEIFAICGTGCESHNAHSVEVSIEPEFTENFAGLLSYNGTEWSLVECEFEDGVITLDFEEDSIYTLVLHDGTGSLSDNSWVIWVVIIAVVVLAGGAAAVCVYTKKKVK